MRKLIPVLLVVCLLSPLVAGACPKIDGLIDFNCDSRLIIGVTGDSFVAGVRDKAGDPVYGAGYVNRLRKKYPDAIVATYGVPGVVSGPMLAKLKKRVPKMGSYPQNLNFRLADYIVVDLGRNDYWEGAAPGETVKNIARIVKYLREELGKGGHVTPEIWVSTLAPTKRGFQRSFINSVNLTLLKYKGNTIPVYVRPDKYMKESQISSDGIHPKTEGYTKMAEIIEKFLEGKAQEIMSKVRKDLDADGIYDNFEASKFGTSKTLADTDGDTFIDGDEVFTWHTDPLDPLSHP
ncbi:MAG: SGNH/GDSL hydrolase family protein [Oligoflexia bacterium]|nr:SGNH/GDSL hydrolase family protein [Oligoflexia bacterium]